MSVKKDVLVLFSFRSHKYGYIEKLFGRLCEAAIGRGINLYRGSLKDMQIEIMDGQLQIRESLTGRKLDEFDSVYFELWYKARQQALAVARYCQRHDIPFFSHEIVDLNPDTKIGELAVLSDNGVPLPRTFTSSRQETKRAFRKAPPIDYPLIVKHDDGYGGHNNFLVKSYAELKGVLDDHRDLTFVIQEFISNDCDYRCVVFGGEIKLVLKRQRDKGRDTHLNNTSAGAEGTMVPINSLSSEAQTAVVKAAKVLGRDGFSGVDLMIDKDTGQPYILEVNQTPQIEIGAEIDKKMAALLDYMERTMK
ncbi:MAG: ATP-grasp domain-containing protein [Candidatus Nomurabacteria bacterium]|jgi:glutathione synthase/RimK-type ligase-like ATP-grasp enzyme|nr:ATP-grasp domain-containing protein [Candidatus Nomurabacteria bacterium]